jgi:coproporphyrinogen III oxidase-like Fe-S oxidoreductase
MSPSITFVANASPRTEVEEPKVKEIIMSKLRFGTTPVSCRRHPLWCHRICAYCVPDYAGELL